MASFAQLNAEEGLPSSVHTEVVILGAMLLDGIAISDATARLKAEDFSLDSHQRVYRAMTDMIAVGHGVDYTTVREEPTRRRSLIRLRTCLPGFLTEGIPRKLKY